MIFWSLWHATKYFLVLLPCYQSSFDNFDEPFSSYNVATNDLYVATNRLLVILICYQKCFTGLIALVAYQRPNATKPMSENWCCLTTNDIVVAFLLQIHPQRRCGYQHPPNHPDWHQIPSGSHRKIAPQRGAGGCGCLIKTFTSPNWVYSHKQKRGWCAGTRTASRGKGGPVLSGMARWL